MHTNISPGSVTIDGSLADWSAADQIDGTLSLAGYDLYAKWTGDSVSFAISAPVAVGGNTTVWLNTDQDDTTGFQIFGFAGGAEFNVNFTPSGTPRLYTGNAGQTLIQNAVISFAASADRRIVEFQVPLSALGNPEAIDTLWDINNATFLPTGYALEPYEVVTSARPPVIGSVTLNGTLDEWTTVPAIDQTLSVAGYNVRAQVAGGHLVFALESPVALGAGTTAWLNTDRNANTGFQIFGTSGGAEFNIDLDEDGIPRLYTGDAGEDLVDVTIPFGTSGNHRIIEFAVPLSAIGSPSFVDTLWDVNNTVFLPTDFEAAQYTAPAPAAIGSIQIDASLDEWTPADLIDQTLSVAGYDIFARAEGGSLVFALRAPVAIGPDTTAWLNTDQNAATGFQIFGFAGGAEFNVNFDANGTPHLYTGNAGQTLVPGAIVSFAASGDRRLVEFAVPLAALGSPEAVNTLWDINDQTFLPTSFALTQYTVTVEPPVAPPPTVVGDVTLDGSLADWSSSDLIDSTLSVAGYDIYASATGGSLVFALQAPVAIGANTTAWLNTDQNASTGFQIFGFAGGAELNINFDASGVPHLYTGNAGQNLVSNATVSFGASADRRIVEFAVPLAAIGSPTAVNTLWDINDQTFLPTSFALAQYTVSVQPPVAPPPIVVGDVTLDGGLNDWTPAHLIDSTLSVAGYDLYGRATGDSLVFAISAPVAIGANTTTWLNTDQDASTGFQIFGFAGGAEFNIDFDASGTPRLYTGNAGQNLVSSATVSFRSSADHRIVEFAVPLAAIGSPDGVDTLWDINDQAFLPTSFALTQYTVTIEPPVVPPPAVVGAVTLDGSLADWTPANLIDRSLSQAGYDIYARVTGDSAVFAVQAPVAVGANTTAWLNTDRDPGTGFQIFGFTGGAELNVNFDASGTPHLYTGNAGQNLVSNVTVAFGTSADGRVVEFAVPLAALGSPAAIGTLWDINDATFLPTSFSALQYELVVTPPSPNVGDVTLDGGLSEWTPSDVIDQELSVAGYDIMAQATGGSLVFAVDAPVEIGAHTTVWLNTDQNELTGFQVFGFAGGAEFNINFDAGGTPRLYTGNAGETLVANAPASFAYSGDRTSVEIAVPLTVIGSPSRVDTLWDINDNTFLPTDYSLETYSVTTA